VAWSYDYHEHNFYHVPNNVPTRFSSANSKIADLPLELLNSKTCPGYNVPEICEKITIWENCRVKISRKFVTYALAATHLIISRFIQWEWWIFISHDIRHVITVNVNINIVSSGPVKKSTMQHNNKYKNYKAYVANKQSLTNQCYLPLID